MLQGNLFCLELRSAFSTKRRVMIRIAAGVLLALPFLAFGMPARVQTGGLVMVFLFTTTIGATVGFERFRDSGKLARLKQLPASTPVVQLDILLAWSLTRLVPAALITFLFLVIQAGSVHLSTAWAAFGMLIGTQLLLTAAGMCVGQTARGGGEGHLFAALTVGVLAVVCGLVPVPDSLVYLQAVLHWNPLAQLAEVLHNAATGTPPSHAVTIAATIVIFGAGALFGWRFAQGKCG